MATQYEIDITMPQATATDLHHGGFSLYGFKAVKSKQGGGAPLVWFKTTNFLTTTEVTWQENYQAYISDTEITANAQIVASTAQDIDLDQTADVNDVGAMTVDQSGIPNAIAINNQGKQPWTCGISQKHDGIFTPMCAFPLYVKMEDVIEPIEKVLLMFATNTVNTGTVIYQAYSSGVIIDLTQNQIRAVNFGINTGWDWGKKPWGKEIAPNENLVPILIAS